MTREDAEKLLAIFRRNNHELPPVSSTILAHAYLKVLGSLPLEASGTREKQ